MAFVTVREQAMLALVDLFVTMEAGLPANDPYTIQFEFVRRNPLDEESWKKLLTLGIHDTREMVKQGPTRTDRFLDIVLEWRRLIRSDEVVDNIGAASSIANEVVGNIQRRLGDNPTLGGLVVDTEETSNEVYIDDFADKQLSGAITLVMKYRTHPSDPRIPL